MTPDTCPGCGEAKAPTDFYAGMTNRCKECHKARVRARYRETRPARAEYERRRFARPERKAKALVYQRTRRKKSPEKYAARTAVGNALRDGRLQRLPCEVCGDPKVQAHHEDYSKPLDVHWLCFVHHREDAHGQTTIPVPDDRVANDDQPMEVQKKEGDKAA